ncbi:MAG TPA: hypothetical protein PK736_02870 [Bacteroidia bacterium]|nr:hypothetical protein [Bacteroidia bacterium]
MDSTKNIWRLSFLFFVICFSIAGCKKEETTQTKYDKRMPQQMLDYGYFKKGTYWIYEDTVSKAIDSVYVFDDYYIVDTLPKDNPNGLEAGIYDEFNINTHSTHFNVDYYYWCNSSQTPDGSRYFIQRGYTTLFIHGSTPCFRFIFEKGKVAFGYSNIPEVTDTMICMNANYSEQIDKKVFTRVVKFSQTANYLENKSLTYFSYSCNIGIIKKEIIKRNEYWILIRYNIIQ